MLNLPMFLLTPSRHVPRSSLTTIATEANPELGSFALSVFNLMKPEGGGFHARHRLLLIVLSAETSGLCSMELAQQYED